MQAFDKLWVRWGFTAALTLLSAGANIMLQPLVAGRAPMLPFFPALIAIGFLAGFWPAIAALLVSVFVMATWSIEPIGIPWPITRPTDFVLLITFLSIGLVGIACTAAARGWLDAYRHTRHRLDMAMSVGRMTTWEWHVPSGRVVLSPGAEDVFGARWDYIDGAWPLMHEDDRERVTALMLSVMNGDATRYSFLSRCVRPDNREDRWIETHGHVMRNSRGEPRRVTGVTIDVDDRQRALDASRAAEERFEVALRGSGIIVWECDAQMRYTWVRNPQLGFEPADFIGRRMGDLVPRNQSAAYHEAAERVLATGRAETVPVRVEINGTTRHYLSTFDARRDPHGEVCGLIGVSLEITDIKSAQEALQREVQRKDNFLATLAHELRNPMAPIRYAVAMLGDDAPPAKRLHARQVIERQSGHMARLLDDLLDMSRITRNAIELQRTRTDLRTMVEQAAETTQRTMADRQHRLTVTLPEEPLWVQGDATRLLQVLGNLLDNAAKYTAPGGDIAITLRREGAQAVLAVRDSGEGLSKASLATVFDLFTRVPQRSRHDPGGLGIGLSVARQLVELHGGSVRAESAGLGFGTTFSVRLPLDTQAAATSAHDAAPSAVVPLGRGCTVLVVDDNADAADMLATVLRLDGYAVSVAYDAESALQAQATLRPDAVLLDIGLPDMSGHEVARRIRHAPGPQPKLVAISGWGQARDIELTQEAGFDAHLVKPVEPDQVRERLQALLDAPSQAAAG
ncbi:MAG: ATP-binding protein [Rhizobacter sp.]